MLYKYTQFIVFALLSAILLIGCSGNAEEIDPRLAEQMADMELMQGALQGQVSQLAQTVEVLEASQSEGERKEGLDSSTLTNQIKALQNENEQLKQAMVEMLLINEMALPERLRKAGWLRRYENQNATVSLYWIANAEESGIAYLVREADRVTWTSPEPMTQLRVYWLDDAGTVAVESGKGAEKVAFLMNWEQMRSLRSFAYLHQLYASPDEAWLYYTAYNNEEHLDIYPDKPTIGLYGVDVYTGDVVVLDPGGKTYRCVMIEVNDEGTIRYERRNTDGTVDHMGVEHAK